MEPKPEQKYSRLQDGRLYRWVRLFPGKKGRTMATGRTPELVEAHAARIEAEYRESQRRKPKPEDEGPTEDYAPGEFGDFCYRVYFPVAYANAEPTTRVLYDYYFRAYIFEVWEHRPIAAIGLEDMRDLERHVATAPKRGGGTLAPKTQREILMRAREAMGLYVKMEEAEGRTPRKTWTLHKPPKAPPKKERAEVDADYSVRLLKAAKGHVLEGPLYCILFLAMRRGEVAAMTRASLDRKNMRVRVTEKLHALNMDGGLPKGGKARDLPVPDAIMDVLDRLGAKAGRLWRNEDGTPMHPDRITHDVPELCVAHGLERKTAHDLRSLCATNLLALGADPVLVMEILGHAQLGVSLMYFDPRAADKRKALGRLLSE